MKGPFTIKLRKTQRGKGDGFALCRERLNNERRTEELSSSMMAAFMLKPELLEPLQQSFQQLQRI